MKISSIGWAVVFLAFFVTSCLAPKDARILKRETKEWREAPVVLYAWADSPFSGTFLMLRDNGKFEHISSGIVQSFEAGNFITDADTIHLEYLDSQKEVVQNQNIIIDRKTSTLIFEGDPTPVQMRLRIVMNEIK